MSLDRIPSNFGEYRTSLLDIVGRLERGQPMKAKILHLFGMLAIQTAQDLHESKHALVRLNRPDVEGDMTPSSPSGDTTTTGIQP